MQQIHSRVKNYYNKKQEYTFYIFAKNNKRVACKTKFSLSISIDIAKKIVFTSFETFGN